MLPALRKTLLLLIAILGVGIVAFVPPLLYRDRDTAVPSSALRQLKTEAARGYTIPPGFAQVIDARAHGQYPYRVEGTVVYRSLFGARVATAHSYNSATTYDVDGVMLLGLWGAFLLVEGTLSLLLCWQLGLLYKQIGPL